MLAKLKAYEPDLDIQDDSCICRLCRDDVTKIAHDSRCIPRWRKSSQVQKDSCCVPDCSMVSSKVTQLVDSTTLCTLLDINKSNLNVSVTMGFPLCTEHYRKLYEKLN